MDLAAVAREIEYVQSKKPDGEKRQPTRAPLPAHLPREDVHHEPARTTCKCGCTMRRIGEDVSEKLDYTPGVFTVERDVRGKWVCAECETLVQMPMDPHIIDKGIPTTRLLQARRLLVGCATRACLIPCPFRLKAGASPLRSPP